MSNPSNSAGHARFGSFEVDFRAGELLKNGRKIRLQDQPLHVLAMLLEKPGEVVTREELRQKLWPGDTFVDFDHGLNNAINRLRDALSDSAEVPRFIETLPRRGYRFIASVETLPATAPPEAATITSPASPALSHVASANRYTYKLTAAAALVLIVVFAWKFAESRRATSASAPPTIHSIAVLPLENLTGDPSQEYFADGMTDELTTNLARIHSLRVISRSTMMRYRNNQKSSPQIARELKVDAIIEGSVVRSGDKVRITTQLIDTRQDTHLWAQSYERRIDDILEVQDSIALDIASQVKANLSPGEREYFATRASIRPDAYDDFLRGRSELGKQNLDAIKKSTEYFRRAIESDPQYAPAYSGLADSFSLLVNYQGLLANDGFPRAKDAALKAIELDPSSPEAHDSLALVKHHYDWDWSGAEAEYKIALQLQPNFARTHLRYAELLSNTGRHTQALEEIRHAEELDPLSMVIHTNVGRVLYHARRYDESIGVLQKAAAIDPNRLYTHIFLGMAYDAKGMCPEATSEFQVADGFTGGREGVGAAHMYATCHKPQDARRVLAILAGPSSDPVQDWFFVAGVYAALGDKDRAFEWLDKAVRHRDFFLTEMQGHPYMDPLRSDPRFRDVVRRIGFPEPERLR